MTPQRITIRNRRHLPGALPRNAVYVGAGSTWQNHFAPGSRYTVGILGHPQVPFPTRFAPLGTHARVDYNTDEPFTIVVREVKSSGEGLELYRRNILGTRGLDTIRRELAGRDLACTCDIADTCHAETLIQLANGAKR